MRRVACAVISSVTICTLFSFSAPANAADGATPIPNFSGIWARQAFDFEAPSSGIGPIQNLEHRPNGIGSNLNKLVGDYMNPILKPEAAERVRQMGEISRTGANFPDPSNQCAVQQPPYLLANQRHVQFLQGKDEIVILYEQDQQVRHVRMNATHPARVTPSWFGDSVGHYEGDTLVVDTIGLKVGPISMVDVYGTPHSEALHLIEHYRLVDYEIAKEATERAIRESGYAVAGAINEGVMFDPDYMGKGLQVQFAVEDTGTFTKTWGAAVTYRRSKSQWVEYACAENTHEYYANRDTPIPVDDTPDF